MSKKLLIIGTQQYVSAAVEVATSMKRYEIIEQLDISRNADVANGNLTSLELHQYEGYEVVVAVRNLKLRLQLVQQLVAAGFVIAEAINIEETDAEVCSRQSDGGEEYRFECGV